MYTGGRVVTGLTPFIHTIHTIHTKKIGGSVGWRKVEGVIYYYYTHTHARAEGADPRNGVVYSVYSVYKSLEAAWLLGFFIHNFWTQLFGSRPKVMYK